MISLRLFETLFLFFMWQLTIGDCVCVCVCASYVQGNKALCSCPSKKRCTHWWIPSPLCYFMDRGRIVTVSTLRHRRERTSERTLSHTPGRRSYPSPGGVQYNEPSAMCAHTHTQTGRQRSALGELVVPLFTAYARDQEQIKKEEKLRADELKISWHTLLQSGGGWRQKERLCRRKKK